MKPITFVMSIFLLIILVSCGDLPPGHTVNLNGAKHKAGYDQPAANCGCHGSQQQGDDGPSCYRCHEKNWE